MLQSKVVQNLISYKKYSGHISSSLPGVELGDAQHLICTGMEKQVHFWAEQCQSTDYIENYSSGDSGLHRFIITMIYSINIT